MNLIAAVDSAWGIGKDGQQPVYIPEDLARFRQLTGGHTVILGRKTLCTFPDGKPLKNRRNMILSRTMEAAPEGAQLYRDVPALLEQAPRDAFVIGGGTVYRQLLSVCDTAYLTKISADFGADTFFPDLDADAEWEIAETSPEQESGGLRYRYVTYRRKNRK